MHFVATRAFSYTGTPYSIGDGIYGTAYSSLVADPNYTYYSFFVVPVSDSNTRVSDTPVGGGPPDMPIVSGAYNVPASATGEAVLSAVPTRIVSIKNTDANPQGASLVLYDCATTAAISSAHQIGTWDLGSGQTDPYQYLTTNGLCYQIIASATGGPTTLNATGSGVDIAYAPV